MTEQGNHNVLIDQIPARADRLEFARGLACLLFVAVVVWLVCALTGN